MRIQQRCPQNQSAPTRADSGDFSEHILALANQAGRVAVALDSTDTSHKKQVFEVRENIQSLVKTLDADLKIGLIRGAVATDVKRELKTLRTYYEFAPTWVILLISLCLGVGTMIGWKRIVVTIGEKIGKTHLTYAQGASAEICAAATIGVSTSFGLPVSTTHVLSSGIAGTMVASGGIVNLQKKTIANIGLAWLLTLPVTFFLSAVLFYFLRIIL
ncbi:MAG: inorganic phosphate transporter [Lewinellaceae bacterium]|nr:inorganic phosphate transporter [Lewinellaceae bacterium]